MYVDGNIKVLFKKVHVRFEARPFKIKLVNSLGSHI